MLINKISTNNTIYSSFGKYNKITSNNNLTDNKSKIKSNNKKEIALILGALALAGVITVALKNPQKIKTQINLLKNKILPETSKKEVQSVSKKAAAISGVAVISAMAVKPNEGEKDKTDNVAENIVPVIDAVPYDVNIDDNNVEVFESETNPSVVEEIEKKAENEEELTEGFSIEKFKKAQGNFVEGKAYLASEPYTGKIIILKGNEQIIMNYENGDLNKTEINEKDNQGIYEPKVIKLFEKDENGTKKIKIFNRKYSLQDSEPTVQWFVAKSYTINDSDIEIMTNDIFDQKLGTYYRKQKNGKWNGYYEDRVFNFYTGPHIIPRDISTGKILTTKQYKKFLEG